MMHTMTRPLLWATVLGAVILTGCARIQLSPPTASADAIQTARSSGIAPAAIAPFSLAAGSPKALDLSVSIRGSTAYSPYQDSLAKYLEETLRTELASAGLLDPKSPYAISGELVRSEVAAGMSEGSAALGARFKVSHNGQSVFDKQLIATDTWPSSFVGAVAIPEALNRYTALYRKLIAALLADPAFVQAMKKPYP